ncbi:alpha-amylase [Kwoniella mangroviensis CBS 10435]|uniref:Alpha-amylase n=1 Tax=Kwoniella mangroviensis CBS 10435 TaxID=1331196 RepID=A0A1B9J148_9TREE|nr:alpha-amylase [Kwoniella mangroviensis CBS 8507]OCF61510.1 alpha-amylase [Kwoniella mangroviensis CBS 10435]OCF63362.1 alpha-amylase [Kwoniella mangroviensis CBS 8507]OCF77530.1 alpha-amylase [Kwoniella mangroviensis CBS 8886]
MAHHANEDARGKPGNYTMMQYFEWYCPSGGVHWKKYADDAEHLADIGITACWLPPPTKGSSPEGTGYDVYDLWDLGEFDQKGSKPTKWGSKEDLLDAIRKAKDNGIISYIDAVLNHKAGADDKEEFLATMVDQNDRNKLVGEMHNIEGWTKFTFPGRGDTYSPLKWNYNHFTGVDYDAKTETKAIFKIQGDGKGWAEDVDDENGSYDYLMFTCPFVVDHNHPEIEQELYKWGDWILKETGAYGFRFDAVKHISQSFIGEFVKHVRSSEGGKAKAFCVGEFWHDSVDALVEYVEGLGTQFSCFDSCLQDNFHTAGEERENYDLRQIFDNTLVQRRPIDAVTLVDNHDTQVGQSLQRWVSSAFKPLAYALILLRVDGYPCVFYGDLYGTGGDNPQQPVAQLEDIIRARKLFAYGELNDYWDHPNCVAWLRKGDEEHDGCVVVICNGKEDGSKKISVGKEHSGEKWTDVMGWHQGEVTIDDEGWAEFFSPPESISIWTKVDARGREEFKKD